MTRFAIDSPIALRLIRENVNVSNEHQLVAPAILRSHALSALYREVREGRMDAAAGRRALDGVAELKVRLLGDRVSRATAWKIAEQLDWGDTSLAEYLAVAKLQADALVTDDDVLAAAAEGIVPLASWDDLTRT
ncbi:type II toxin-antitoxin system VapC family toxin [Microbacterium sp. NPDC057407]|uniref:type II toxin-antitoxin system VapC family toxin n=1 Tax=Microbacterium sp. NPDC057407 TaxID=3346120 RepID=UPI0036708D57